ncbi:Uncharacterised protein [Yersinia pseudotuberculosis]|nr:Uncharacterised protein [Yersinia pseudotuberculosis]CNI18240.1 Uncharacterised protein [Yersinia pseudotuberculosis]CNI49487.1 Uncharacterised protein [Yersinia pseudotuberculosis]CNL80768.1 Uncharacterised protein [Yersinia pseudotuberculosis]
MVTLLLPSPRLITSLLCELLSSTNVSLPAPVVNVPSSVPLLLMIWSATPANITLPLMVPLLFNVLLEEPKKLIAVAAVASIWVSAPMVVSPEPSAIWRAVPSVPVTVIVRLESVKSSAPPPVALIPTPAPETLISNASASSALSAVFVAAIPVPVPETLIVLRPSVLLAKVRPDRSFSTVPLAVLKMTCLNSRFTPAAFAKALPVPFRLKIKSVRVWLPLLPIKFSPVAAFVVVIFPPNRFNNVPFAILIAVPAEALMLPRVLSTVLVPTPEAIAIPALVLLIVPSLITLAVPVPVLVTDIPVAAVITP